jgi:hypothetical protein
MRIPGRGRLNRFQTAVPKKKRKKICQFFLAHTHRVSELEFRWIFHRTKFPSTREALEWLAQWSLEPVDLFTFMCVRLCIYTLHKAAGSWCLQGRKESSERDNKREKPELFLTCTSCADIYHI